MVLIISSLSVVPGTAAAASPGSLLEKQISSPHPRCTESGTLEAGLRNKPAGDSNEQWSFITDFDENTGEKKS